MLTKQILRVELTFSSYKQAYSFVCNLPNPGLPQVRKQLGKWYFKINEKSGSFVSSWGKLILNFCVKVRENGNNFTLGLEGWKKQWRLLWSQLMFFLNEEKICWKHIGNCEEVWTAPRKTCQLTVDCLLADCRPSVGQLSAICWLTVGHLLLHNKQLKV